jgi:hypothetical protein
LVHQGFRRAGTAQVALLELDKLKLDESQKFSLRSTLSQILRAYQDPGRGDFTQSNRITPSHGAAIEQSLNAAHERALRFVIAKQAGAPRLMEEPLVRKPLEEAIQSVVDEQAAKGLWEAVADLCGVAQNAGFDRATFRAEGFQASALVAGQRSEQAGDFVIAVQSFRQVLRDCRDKTMLEFATKHLREIGQAHPAALATPEPGVTGTPKR